MKFIESAFELLRPIFELILSFTIVSVPTIIASYAMGTVLVLKMLKDMVDNGYKMDIERLKQLPKNKLMTIAMFIPIVNIITMLYATMQYANNNSLLIDQFRVFDVLIPMTEEEKKEYKKEPTLLNVFRVINNYYIEKDTIKIIYTDGNDRSIIYYKIKDGTRKIIKVEGPLSKLSIFEQQIKLNEILEDDRFNFVEELVSGSSNLILIKTDENIEEKSNANLNESTLQNRKEQLKQLRDDLISQKESIQQESEEVKTYKKEMK